MSTEGFAFNCWVRLRFPHYAGTDMFDADALLRDMWREDAR